MRKSQTMQELRQRQQIVYSTIPGMNELLHANPSQVLQIQAQYPDAVFAVEVADNLFHHNRELSLITQKAYFSILNGENISDVRFRYEKETDAFWSEHMWDD